MTPEYTRIENRRMLENLTGRNGVDEPVKPEPVGRQIPVTDLERRQVLSVMDHRERTCSEIGARIHMSPQRTHRILSVMAREGHVKRFGDVYDGSRRISTWVVIDAER